MIESALRLIKTTPTIAAAATTSVAWRPNSGTLVTGRQNSRVTTPVAVAAAERVILVRLTPVTVVPEAMPGPDTVMPVVTPENLAAVMATEPATVATPTMLTQEG